MAARAKAKTDGLRKYLDRYRRGSNGVDIDGWTVKDLVTPRRPGSLR